MFLVVNLHAGLVTQGGYVAHQGVKRTLVFCKQSPERGDDHGRSVTPLVTAYTLSNAYSP